MSEVKFIEGQECLWDEVYVAERHYKAALAREAALQARLNTTDQRNADATDLLRRAHAVIDGAGWTDLEADIAAFLAPNDGPLTDEGTITKVSDHVEHPSHMVTQAMVDEPFFYALCGPDGKPHYDDFCVSSDPHHLESSEDGVNVVPLYRHAPSDFQVRVQPWMMACFGAEISADQQERNHRFLEEALELVQACGSTQSEAHQLVEYVYGREVGEKAQEVGGVMVTLAALCLAQGLDMHAAGETELSRIWTKVEQIRAKQLLKPSMSPLPGVYPDRKILNGDQP